jgi:cytochrome c peroxidase
MRWWMGVVLAVAGPIVSSSWTVAEPRPEPHRSPVDVAVLAGGRLAVTANSTADSVSLIDLAEGRVLFEAAVGRKPAGVACSPDGQRAAVSNLWDGTITLLEREGNRLRAAGTVRVGAFPRGLAFGDGGKTLYVAVSGDDAIVAVDWASREVQQCFEAPREPRRLALSADGRWLAAGSSRSGRVRCWDTRTGKLHWERRIFDSFNLEHLAFSPDGVEVIATHVINRDRPITLHHIAEGWVIDNRLARLPVAADAPTPVWAIGLDVRSEASADPYGLAFTADGGTLLVTAAGSHELLLLPSAHIPWSPGEPGDFLDTQLEVGPHRLRRIALGGRPMTVAVHGHRAIIANSLLDAVQVVDLAAENLVRTIALGGPPTASLARQGEALFYDARKSHGQWFSCHTCHTDGHTCGQSFDTLNDNSYGNFKLTPTLRNVARTAPYTWHGWQDKLEEAIEKSYRETLFGPKPTADEVRAVAAFLATLEHPPHPRRSADGRLGPAAARGRELFHGAARCDRCHKGELYFSPGNFDLKLRSDGSPYELWNPPSLLGLYDRGPYLHDGRAHTLDDLLRLYHTPQSLGGQPLTDEQRQDLIEFLKTL